jgi:hypothetical protein
METGMSGSAVEIVRLIHETLGMVVTYALSGAARLELREKMSSVSKYVDQGLLHGPEERATRALIEFAVMLRTLDDDEGITKNPKLGGKRFGDIYHPKGKPTPISLREVTNKIIHSSRIEWDFFDKKGPKIVCIAHPREAVKHNWIRAVIHVNKLAMECGSSI